MAAEATRARRDEPAGDSVDEWRALSRLAFSELAAAPGGIAAVHRAIADRAFVAAAPGVRATHDAIAGVSYGAVRAGATAAGALVDGVLSRRRDGGERFDARAPSDASAVAAPDGRALSTTPRGAAALGVICGLIGDRLEREGSDLHEPMSVRVAGRAVPPGGDATHLVVFVHGLFETELSWGFGGRAPYGARLARDLGCTPVFLRYNSGIHVSENGRALADLLANWPGEVDRISLVGHSMGGLVARSACHQASERGDAWVRRVRHIVTLGTPHRGAPLEQGLHAAGAALAALPETRPFASLLRRRSAGIRDMRRGSLVDEDWRGRDPDALRAAACREVPLLEGATHCFLAATFMNGPVGRVLGDWLVLAPSASYIAEHAVHVGGLHHLALLNHPAVYERLRETLAQAPPPA